MTKTQDTRHRFEMLLPADILAKLDKLAELRRKSRGELRACRASTIRELIKSA